MIAEIARLSPAQRKVAAKYPNALPLLLTDPVGVTELVNRWSGDPADLADALALLTFISLEPGAADLRSAIRTLDDHGSLALDAFRVRGLDGFALVKLYGPVLDALGRALPLDQALILLRVNSAYVDELLASHQPETVAGHLRHVAAAGLVEQVGGSPDALRLAVEFGDRGERALIQAGPDAADVVFGDFADATLRNQAVEALAEHGTMALAMLDKYAADADFREILRADGPAVIPPIARADAGPEALALLQSKPRWSWTDRLAHSVLALSGDNGQATIRLIKDDGLAPGRRAGEVRRRVPAVLAALRPAPPGQRRPPGPVADGGRDGLGAGRRLLRGPRRPEPGGGPARGGGRLRGRAVRGPVGGQAGRSIGRPRGDRIGHRPTPAGRSPAEGWPKGPRPPPSSARLARWWAVRAAGGTYQVLRRLPEALPKTDRPRDRRPRPRPLRQGRPHA